MKIRQRWTRRIGILIAGLCLALIGTSATWAARPGVIMGHVTEGPVTPVCQPNIPCTKPFSHATIQVLDSATRNPVGTAVTNRFGNFRAAVPRGRYLVHVHVVGLFPRCPEVAAVVRPRHVTRVKIACDTGIR